MAQVGVGLRVDVMIWHLQTLFKLFHGGFIPYANGLFHKPKPHPLGFFHNSCGHNNTRQIISINTDRVIQ
jgi:hypothetical protein